MVHNINIVQSTRYLSFHPFFWNPLVPDVYIWFDMVLQMPQYGHWLGANTVILFLCWEDPVQWVYQRFSEQKSFSE